MSLSPEVDGVRHPQENDDTDALTSMYLTAWTDVYDMSPWTCLTHAGSKMYGLCKHPAIQGRVTTVTAAALLVPGWPGRQVLPGCRKCAAYVCIKGHILTQVGARTQNIQPRPGQHCSKSSVINCTTAAPTLLGTEFQDTRVGTPIAVQQWCVASLEHAPVPLQHPGSIMTVAVATTALLLPSGGQLPVAACASPHGNGWEPTSMRSMWGDQSYGVQGPQDTDERELYRQRQVETGVRS